MGAKTSAVAHRKIRMQMDYKIAEERIENGEVVYQRVRFYEGSMVTESFNTPEGTIESTYYKRTRLVDEVEYVYG